MTKSIRLIRLLEAQDNHGSRATSLGKEGLPSDRLFRVHIFSSMEMEIKAPGQLFFFFIQGLYSFVLGVLLLKE